MLKKEKHYGEVWFPGGEDQRFFCILTHRDHKIFLETNLVSNERYIKHQMILGIFAELGYITFIDCQINMMSNGLTNNAIYQPRYTFVHADHFIDPTNLWIRKFKIFNNDLVNWHQIQFDLNREDKVLKFDTSVSYAYAINDANPALTIDIEFYLHTKVGREEFLSRKQAVAVFTTDKAIRVIQAIELYHKFQDLLQFLSGNSCQFERFRFECPDDCNHSIHLYFKDNRYGDHRMASPCIDFVAIQPYLRILLEAMYTNQSFAFCVNQLLDNQATGNLSHSKRFTNSVSSFEAYHKLFGQGSKSSLKKALEAEAELLAQLTKTTSTDLNNFIQKIIRSRNYHIHSNIKDQNIFSDFELLYISILLDFVIVIRLLQQFDVARLVIDKIIRRGQLIYVESQNMNKLLNHDYLKDN